MDEVGNDLRHARRMHDFGMELHSEESLHTILDGGVGRVFGNGDGLKPARQLRELVPVRIPNLELGGQIDEQRASSVFDGELPLAVFAFVATLDFPAKILSEQLQAVTNS